MPSDNSEKCPQCNSANLAQILYGKKAMSDELRNKIEQGVVVLGSCAVDGVRASTHCNDCDHQF